MHMSNYLLPFLDTGIDNICIYLSILRFLTYILYLDCDKLSMKTFFLIVHQERNFIKCPYEHALYIKIQNGNIRIVCLYVDDLIFIGSNPSMFHDFKKEGMKEF